MRTRYQNRGLFHGWTSVFFQIFYFFTASQGSPTLVIVNDTGSFNFVANTESEIHFHIKDLLKEQYTIFVNFKAFGGNISRLRCYLNKNGENCSFSSKVCECLNEAPGHQYRLKKSFQGSDSGTWTFAFLQRGLSFIRSINITVEPREGDHTTTVIRETTERFTDYKPLGGGNSSQGTFVLTEASTTHFVTNPGMSLHTHDAYIGWRITLIVVATCLVIVVFGVVVACTTWRCAYIHLERRTSERLACLAGVETTHSHLRLTMEPVYDTVPASSRRLRVTMKESDRLHQTPDNSQAGSSLHS